MGMGEELNTAAWYGGGSRPVPVAKDSGNGSSGHLNPRAGQEVSDLLEMTEMGPSGREDAKRNFLAVHRFPVTDEMIEARRRDRGGRAVSHGRNGGHVSVR